MPQRRKKKPGFKHTNWASKKKETLGRAIRWGTEAKKLKHNVANQFCDVILGRTTGRTIHSSNIQTYLNEEHVCNCWQLHRPEYLFTVQCLYEITFLSLSRGESSFSQIKWFYIIQGVSENRKLNDLFNPFMCTNK